MDDYTIEIIVFVIILLIVAGKPYSIMKLAESILGKFILLIIIVALALKSTIAGLLGALLIVVLSEGLREGLDTKEEEEKKDKKKDDHIIKVKKGTESDTDTSKEAKKQKTNKDEGDKKDIKDIKDKKDKKDESEEKSGKKEKGSDSKKEVKNDRLGIKETMEKLQKLAAITNNLS